MLNIMISIILFIILVFFLISINWNINKDPRMILLLMTCIWIKEYYIRDTYNIHERTVIDDLVTCLIYLAIGIFLFKNIKYAMFGN